MYIYVHAHAHTHMYMYIYEWRSCRVAGVPDQGPDPGRTWPLGLISSRRQRWGYCYGLDSASFKDYFVYSHLIKSTHKVASYV